MKVSKKQEIIKNLIDLREKIALYTDVDEITPECDIDLAMSWVDKINKIIDKIESKE